MKKGFTLVETLAVITVIVLLGLITIPAITKNLESNEEKVFKETVEQIVEAVRIYRADYELTDENVLYDVVNNSNIEYAKKNKIISGSVTVQNSSYRVINISNGEYCANGNIDNLTITKGECN